MTLEWIPLDRLRPHPENSNRMPPALLEKLKRHIQRTGLYEPLVVRPLPQGAADGRAPGVAPAAPYSAPDERTGGGARTGAPPRYQILNGHHRAEVLRQLGHTHARCDVWQVGDDDARLLLATLNRLEGRDDPAARGRLLARLAGGRSAEDLARLLPDPPDAIARLRQLAEPPPAPLAPAPAAPEHRPMTFFLTEEQYALVSEALAEAGAAPIDDAPAAAVPGAAKRGGRERAGGCSAVAGTATAACAKQAPAAVPPAAVPGAAERALPRAPSRAERLERLALWYLEARGRR
ncbi:MAG: hypothetical protein FJ288_02550 [Planctomycetes bacterium]|nr:hypothetical protein [Planctomycetota bacterium]